MVNLAVIGAGIGGCSSAYFAHKYLPKSKLTVYETENRIGGRAFTFNDNGIKSEIGAAFFNPNNKIICNLVKEIGLKTEKLEEVSEIAVWNGTEIIFKSNHLMFYNVLKLFSKYKLSVPKLLLGLIDANGKIKKLYENEKPTELWELFEKVGLDKWYKMPFDQILVEKGIDRNVIDDLITPITRIIYSQNAELGGFAGLSSLLGIYGESVYSLKDGNNVLPRKLLEASNSEVKLENKVENVEKTSKDTFRVSVGDITSVFDGVIVAAPLEVADITFDGVTNQKWQAREYQKIHIQLMKGAVNRRYFNLDSSSNLPSIILTSKDADPITHLSINKSTNNESLVTVTSTEPLSNDILDDIFENRRTILKHTWSAAYPIFKPIEKIPPTCIDKGLLYLNAVESAASSLESSTFAALNSIKMIKEQISS
jgi:prenylcysteine oxidase / farnesylcysteine lyase